MSLAVGVASAGGSSPECSGTTNGTRVLPPPKEGVSERDVPLRQRTDSGAETNRPFQFTGLLTGEPLSTFASTILAVSTLQVLETARIAESNPIVLRVMRSVIVNKDLGLTDRDAPVPVKIPKMEAVCNIGRLRENR